MKLTKLWLVAGICSAVLSLQSANTWASRMVNAISGSVTAVPTAGQIEVDHVVYRVKVNSAADKSLRSFHTGDVVDLIMDNTGGSQTATVVSIVAHPRS